MGEKYRKIGNVIILLGFIGGCYLAYQFGNVINFEYAGHVYYERNWFITILYFALGFISSVILGSIFTGIADIMDKLDEINNQQKNTIEIINKENSADK